MIQYLVYEEYEDFDKGNILEFLSLKNADDYFQKFVEVECYHTKVQRKLIIEKKETGQVFYEFQMNCTYSDKWRWVRKDDEKGCSIHPEFIELHELKDHFAKDLEEGLIPDFTKSNLFQKYKRNGVLRKPYNWFYNENGKCMYDAVFLELYWGIWEFKEEQFPPFNLDLTKNFSRNASDS
jgi:hypothetical protein